MVTSVALVGASGKLGKIIAGVIENLDGFELKASITSSSGLAGIDSVDLVIDASTPDISRQVVHSCVARGTNVLVGTSGWSPEQVTELVPMVRSAGSGVVFIPNFSVGSVIGTALAALAAPFFPSAEIIEAHHDHKIDSPSGTAVRTADRIAAARESVGPISAPFSDQPARGELTRGVPIHSLRRPGVIAKQEAILAGPGESLSIIHDTTDPVAAYEPGIRLALPFTRDARGVVVGLENIIDLGLGR